MRVEQAEGEPRPRNSLLTLVAISSITQPELLGAAGLVLSVRCYQLCQGRPETALSVQTQEGGARPDYSRETCLSLNCHESRSVC